MPSISNELLRALESDESCELDQIVKDGNQEDLEALQSLLSMDPSVHPEHRRKALYALGRWGDPTSVSAIKALLPQLDEGERIAAVDALGRLGTQEAFEGVVDYVTDPSPHVRKFAIHALGRIGTPEARAKLVEIEAADSVEYVRALASKYVKRGDQ